MSIDVRRTCVETTLSPADEVGAGVDVEQHLDVVRSRRLDHRFQRQPRVGDTHGWMILQHVAGALRIVGSRVCGTSGRRIMLIPMPEISVMVC